MVKQEKFDIPEIEETAVRKMTLKEEIEYRLQSFWDEHKEKVIFGGIAGACTAGLIFTIGRGVKRQKIFTKEVQVKYGPNASHGMIFDGSLKKRRADLKAWEEGDRKPEFYKVLEFAKTLKLKDGDSYTIEGFNNPDDQHIAVSVWQQCGMSSHSDWI